MTSHVDLETHLRLFGPRALMRAGLGLMQGWADVIGRAAPGRDARARWVELQNKLETFSLFEHVDAVLRLGAGPGLSLETCVARAEALDPFARVWAWEGIGHYYTEQRWARDGAPRALFTGAPPDRSAIPLHAGMGLSIATRVLDSLDARPSSAALVNAIDRWLGLCETNARSEYLGATIEPMGLVVRTLHPELVGAFGNALARWFTAWTPYFWHGVGRGVYFTPSTALPILDSHRRGLEIVNGEPPDDAGRANALAGLVWAITLVNLRQPEVMETFLTVHGEALDSPAMRHGIRSALVLWRDAAPDDPCAAAFRDHTPLTEDVRYVWRSVIRCGSDDEIGRRRERLWHDGCLGELFRFDPAAEWSGRDQPQCDDEGLGARATAGSAA